MILFPPCKINLGLKIIRKRTDGFHDLETLFYPIPLCDALEVVKGNSINNNEVALITEGLKVAGDPNNNLILKAYQLLAKNYPLPPVTFCLLKNIPMGAGLGGGSSDGAFAIQLLDQYFGLHISFSDRVAFAAQLGSDCAFFMHQQPCIGSGKGEVLEPITFSLKGFWIVLVKPPIHISTAEAFAKVKPSEFELGNSIQQIIESPIENWKANLHNDFEDSIFPNHPILATIKNQLYTYGASYAAMSGSGSTLFGLFKFEPKLGQHFTDNFYWEAQLN